MHISKTSVAFCRLTKSSGRWVASGCALSRRSTDLLSYLLFFTRAACRQSTTIMPENQITFTWHLCLDCSKSPGRTRFLLQRLSLGLSYLASIHYWERWAGQVTWMWDEYLPRKLVYVELSGGKGTQWPDIMIQGHSHSHEIARSIKEAILNRDNHPSLNRNIGKYQLPHIWDEVAVNSPDST